MPTETIDQNRRRLLGFAAVTLAATEIGLFRPAQAQTAPAGTGAGFGPLKQVDAGLLSVGYLEAGSPTGPVALQGCNHG